VVYSIVSSARSRAACGMTKPDDFAVLRFSTNSNLVGNSAGKSAGFTPRSNASGRRRHGTGIEESDLLDRWDLLRAHRKRPRSCRAA
jgi:hypothetical protein